MDTYRGELQRTSPLDAATPHIGDLQDHGRVRRDGDHRSRHAIAYQYGSLRFRWPGRFMPGPAGPTWGFGQSRPWNPRDEGSDARP